MKGVLKFISVQLQRGTNFWKIKYSAKTSPNGK